MTFHDLSLNEVRDLSESAAAVGAAAEVGILQRLRRGPVSLEELARDLDLDRRAVEILVPVLEELEFVEVRKGELAEGPRARRELWDEAGGYLGRGLPLWLSNLRALTFLPRVLRTGRPIEDDSRGDDPEGLARFMAGMAATPAQRVSRVVDACLERVPDAGSVLDLGGGPGHMARAFVDRGLRATLLDRSEVLEFVSDEYGLREVEGLTLVGADFTRDPLPPGPFDLVLVSNVLHMYPPKTNRELLGRIRSLTTPGGGVGVAEFLRGRSGRAPWMGLVMLLRTEGGNVYTEEEYGQWLREAGFHEPVTHQVDTDRHLITARSSTS
jgi:SAM-dependent methyltransferase